MTTRLFDAAELGLGYMKELRALEVVGDTRLEEHITDVQRVLLEERNEVPGLVLTRDVDFRRETAALLLHTILGEVVNEPEPVTLKQLADQAVELTDKLIKALG